jgi:iron-sulfur cluster protein
MGYKVLSNAPPIRTIARHVDTEGLNLSLEFSVYDDSAASEIATAKSLTDLAVVLAHRAGESASSFVRAIEKCEKRDIHGASQSFFDFLTEPECRFDLEFFPQTTGYRLSIHEREAMATTTRGRSDVLASLLDHYCKASSGNNELETHKQIPPLIEALGLANARSLCIENKFDTAHQLIHQLLFLSRASIHLRAAEHAIGLLLKGDDVPAHLKKFVGIDANALADRFCPVPFARVDVHQSGEVGVCCSHWLPTNIGSVFNGTSERILNSETAKAIRRSVVDGSFKYCSHTDCEPLINNKLPFKKDYVGKDFDDDYYHIDKNILEDAFEFKRFDIPNVSYLIFCLDRTCNLTCPSCRTHLIMVKGEERDQLYTVTDSVVLPMLRNAKRVMVNPSGEVFVSRPSRRLLERLAEPGYENVLVDIITNGTLCEQREWEKFSHLFGRIHIIRVSIDGASKAAIEKLRRGANYEILLENLHNLQRMHTAGLFRYFFVSFTYQRDNLFEMEEFLHFARSFGATTAIFERLQNVGAFTPEEYYARAVHLVDHPNHRDFLRIAARVKQDPMVYIDFDPQPARPATHLAST